MARAPARPALVLRVLALLGCCTQLARAFPSYGDPDYYTKLSDIAPSTGVLSQGHHLGVSGFDPDELWYTLDVKDDSVTEVVFDLMLDLEKYNLMFTPQVMFYDSKDAGEGHTQEYNPMEGIRLVVPLELNDRGLYDQTVQVKVSDPQTMGDTENSHIYSINIRRRKACHAEEILLLNSTGEEQESLPMFQPQNLAYKYVVEDSEAVLRLRCVKDADAFATIDSDGHNYIEYETRWNLSEGSSRNISARCTCTYWWLDKITYDVVVERPVRAGGCSLLPGLFGVAVQGALFLMSLLVLVIKKKREDMTAREHARDWPTFLFDSSKQLIGAGFVHGLNLLSAHLLGGRFEGDGCEFYLLSIVVDTTVGVGIEYLLLWALTEALESFGCRPKRFFRSGEYLNAEGRFDWTRYASQLVVWLACVTGMKLTVVAFMVAWHGPLQHASKAFLDLVCEGGPQVELVVVMIVTPCFANAFQFWLTDNFIKMQAPASSSSSSRETAALLT